MGCCAFYLEVPQGVSNGRAFDAARQVLGAQTLLSPQDDLETAEAAAKPCQRARAAGFTVQKTGDRLIAATALEHGATLVHNDRDFIALGRVEPALSLYPPVAGFQYGLG